MMRWLGMAVLTALLGMALCGCTNPFLVSEKDVNATPETMGSAPSGSAEAVEKQEALPLAGYVICLDAGHGITSESKSEAVSPNSSETKPAYVSGAEGAHQTEEALNLAVSKLVRKRLETRGVTVIMTRETHRATVSNMERAEIANKAKADLCIRIHADSAEESTAQGISTLIPAGELLGMPSIAAPSREAAQCIQAAMVEETGAHDRGLVERSDLTGFNWSEVPTVLVEMGFLSNPKEEAQLADKAYRKKLARGIARGAEQWLLGQS